MKKILSLFVAIILVINPLVLSVADFNAPKLTEEEWDMLYGSLCEENNLPLLNVGSDETSVSLCWHSDADKAKAEVRFSENADMSVYKTFKGTVTEAVTDEQVVCRVVIDGLEANKTYYYQWFDGADFSKAYKYETKSFGDHKAVVFGDIQVAEDWRDGKDAPTQKEIGFNWNNVLSVALENNPDISYLVTPGDNTSTGQTAREWQTLLMPEAVRSLPMAMAIGNHDKKGDTYNYYTNMPNEYYGKYFRGLDRDFWFRYGDVLYLVFDSTSGDAPDHMDFAREAVEKNKDAKWRIGVVHHGIYGAGDAIGDSETEILLTTIFAPIFESYDLDLVITGHTHSQGRSHFMENGKVVGNADGGKTYTNPKGVMYLNANSVCEKVIMDYEADHLAYGFIEIDVTTYTTLEFKGDDLILETRRGDNNVLLDSVTINKTIEHNEDSFGNVMKRVGYKVIEFAGFVYTMIDNLVRKFQ